MICLLGACNEAPTAGSAAADPGSERGTPVVVARIVRNTMDPIAVLAGNGHHLAVTGPIACTAGQRAELRVTVTQRTTGAVAEGRTSVTCTGSDQIWQVQLQKAGKEALEEGAATAVAVARTYDGGQVTDAHQWLVSMTLTP
jgi:hypothetical protein